MVTSLSFAQNCEHDFTDGEGVIAAGFTNDYAIANDILIEANKNFVIDSIGFSVVYIEGLPTTFDLEIFKDNGDGGVGNSTGIVRQFNSSNMTYQEDGLYAQSGLTKYWVTLEVSDIELTSDELEDTRYWIALHTESNTNDNLAFWVSYEYTSNSESLPSWQYSGVDAIPIGWEIYTDDNKEYEGLMIVSGSCEDGSLGIDSFKNSNFSYFITDNQLILSNNINMDKVSIFSLSGQLVLSQNIQGTNAAIGLEKLNTGIYIAKILTNGNHKTFMFAKN